MEPLTYVIIFGFAAVVGGAIAAFWKTEQYIDNYNNGGDKMVQVEKSETNWLNGNKCKENSITELVIVTEPIPEEGQFGVKLTCKVNANSTDYNWSMNDTSKNALIEKFGKETKSWIGKKIPIETALSSNNKRAILVDVAKLGGILG